MDPARIDDDARRTLEERAVKNVSALAQRLGRTDALDRYGERFMVICTGVIVLLVVSAVAISFAMTPANPRQDELRRCEVETAVEIVWGRRKALREVNPGITDRELERIVSVTHDHVKSEAARRCRRGY